MLQNIRDNTQGIMAKIIIALIIVPFALFGIDSLVGGGGGPAKAASVNGEEITVASLERMIIGQQRRIQSAMGENTDPSMLEESRLRGPALEQLIQQKLLLQAAQETSVGVSSAQIDQSIVRMPEFQEDGKFSPQLYQNVLRRNNYTLAYFKQILADDILINQLSSGLSGSDFVTKKELGVIASIIGQKRAYRYMLLPLAGFTEQAEVSDSAVEQYYQENPENFQTEDRLKLEYVEVKLSDFFQSVTDEKLREAYELELDDFKVSEERRASHILLEVTDSRNEQQAKELVQKLAERLQQGEDFSTLAKELSDDTGSARNKGDLGYTKGDTFPAAFEEALFALSLNEVSAPVQTDAGFHLIVATEINGMEAPTFEQRRAAIEQRLQASAAERVFSSAVEELRDLVFNSEGLSGPAGDLELTVSTSGWLSRSSATGTLANPQVLAAAYSSDVLSEGNNSELLELATNHFVVVNVLEHDAPHTKPMDEVRDQVAAILKRAQAAKLATTSAEQHLSALAAGKTLEELAQENDYEWQVVSAQTRNAAGANRDLVSAVFDMPALVGEASVRETVALANGDIAVVQLDKVVPGSWDQFNQLEQNGIRGELERNYGARSFDSFVKSLRSQAEINIL